MTKIVACMFVKIISNDKQLMTATGPTELMPRLGKSS